MTISRIDGPMIVTGLRGNLGSTTGLTGVAGPPVYVSGANENIDSAPSNFFGGTMLRDFRVPVRADGLGLTPPASTTSGTGAYANQDFGFASHCVQTIDAAPATLLTTNILNNVAFTAGQTIGAGQTTGFTAGAGCTLVPAGGYAVPGFATVIPAGAILVDAAPIYRAFGQSGAIEGWTGNGPGRCLQFGAAVTTVVTIRGWDIYGQPITQQVTNPTLNLATTKGFKWVGSVTSSAAVSISLGTSDVFEFPIYCARAADLLIWYTTGLIVNPTITAGVTTSPNTPTLGSSRGTFLLPAASNGTNTLVVRQFIRPVNLDTSIGTFGVAMV